MANTVEAALQNSDPEETNENLCEWRFSRQKTDRRTQVGFGGKTFWNRENPEAIKGAAIITPPEDCEPEFEEDYEEDHEEGHEEDHGEDYWTNG